MITWEYFSKRRNINLQNFVYKQEIKKYEDLQAFCVGRNVVPPTEEQYNSAYNAAFPPTKQKPVKPAKKASPKPSRKKRSYVRKNKPSAKEK